MTQQTEPLTELPKSLQFDNMLLSLALVWNPLWYASMMWADARDRRRNKWRIPKPPATLSMYCPPNMAPVQIERHLWDRGVQTGGGGLMWELVGGTIQLHQWFYVPGRLHQWADYCLRRWGIPLTSLPHPQNRGTVASGPVPARGPQVAAHNLDMALTQALMRIVAPGLAAGIIGKSPKEATRRLGKVSKRHGATDSGVIARQMRIWRK